MVSVMILSAENSVQSIIKTVRVRLLLKDLYRQLLIGLTLATVTLTIISFMHVFYRPVPIQNALVLASIPFVLLFGYTFFFCRPTNETICKKADRLLDSKSLILTAWDAANSNPLPIFRTHQIIQQQVDRTYHEGKDSLRESLSIRVQNNLYVLLACLLSGILLLSIHPSTQSQPTNTKNELAMKDVGETALEDKAILANHAAVNKIRSLFDIDKKNSGDYLNTNNSQSSPPNKKISTRGSLPNRQSSPTSSNHVREEQNKVQSNKATGSKKANHLKNANSNSPGEKSADKSAQNNSNKPNISISNTPIHLNKGNEISASPYASSPYTQIKKSSNSVNVQSSARNNHVISNTKSAVQYDADFPPAVQAYINNYKLKMEHNND